MDYLDNNQIHVFDSSSNENKRRIPFKRDFGRGKIKRMSCGLMLYKGMAIKTVEKFDGNFQMKFALSPTIIRY